MSGEASAQTDERALDLAFAAAWPAAEAVDDDGWLLRATAGVTRRGNSALALGALADLDRRLERVERWYRERDLVPRVQIVPSSPAGLEEALQRRGWSVGDGACLLLEADLAAGAAMAAGSAPEAGWTVSGVDAPSAAWTEVWWEVSPRGGEPELRHALGILGRVPRPRRFALAHGSDGSPVGCALGVIVDETLVLESVATREGARRRGVCRALTAALAGWATAGGARRAVLTVERANAGGVATWRRLGFRERGGWTYAAAPSP